MRFLRYPGGKSKSLSFLINYLPQNDDIKGKYIGPFVGGGSVFLFVQPKHAILSDLNKELIDLYKGIRNYPHKVWETFESFPRGKKAYYKIRDEDLNGKHLFYRAARIKLPWLGRRNPGHFLIICNSLVSTPRADQSLSPTIRISEVRYSILTQQPLMGLIRTTGQRSLSNIMIIIK